MKLRKLAPKNIKVCPGCPPKDIPPVTTPKFSMKLPSKTQDSQVTTLKEKLPDANSRVRRGNSTTLF